MGICDCGSLLRLACVSVRLEMRHWGGGHGLGGCPASGRLRAQNLKLMPPQQACALDLSQLDSREPQGARAPNFQHPFPPH